MIQQENQKLYGIEKIISLDKLHPSHPALEHHVLRALWQINEWYQSSKPVIELMEVANHGWFIQNGLIFTNYYEGITALELLQKYFCSCSGQSLCSTEVCPCKQFNLDCCELCSCKSCSNKLENILIENL